MKNLHLQTIYAFRPERELCVLLPDALDVRTLTAAAALASMENITPILVGATEKIEEMMTLHSIASSGIIIENPELSPKKHMYAEEYFALRRNKGETLESAASLMNDSLYYAAMKLRRGEAHSCVAGSLSATADVLRAALRCVGLEAGISTLSSYFLMLFEDKTWVYADCGVVPEPTAEQLVEIAFLASQNFQYITHTDPKVAFLSFSTKGSATHSSIEQVVEAARQFQEKYPTIEADGELQFDAAILPAVAERKAPGSAVAGAANIFIFPNLNSGNIAYKITERLGKAQAIGPIIQGTAKPFFDLSRGCSSDDIVVSALLSLIIAEEQSKNALKSKGAII